MSGIILIMMFVLFALFIFASMIYYLIYKRSVNRHLKDCQCKKKMISPFWMTWIFFVCALIVFATIAAGILIKEDHRIYDDSVYDCFVYTKEEADNSWLANFSIEENKGYRKRVEVVDDIRFTIFVNDDLYNNYHPAFLIYVQYLKEDDLMVDLSSELLNSSGQVIKTFGACGSRMSDYLVFVGNTSIDGTLSLTINLFNEKDVTKGDMIELDKIEAAALNHAAILVDIVHG